MLKKYHRFGLKDMTSLGIRADKFTLEEAIEKAKSENPEYNYFGTFSEYYPIQLGRNYLATIQKNTSRKGSEFVLKTHRNRHYSEVFRNGTCMHSSELNNNSSIGFTKQDLLDLANSMEDNDKFVVMCVQLGQDNFNTKHFLDNLCEVETINSKV